MSNHERAEAARAAARKLGDTLYEKQMAYGDSGAIALGVWQARLAQYLAPANVEWKGENGTVVGRHNPAGHYVIPVELIAHLPRITRLDDRINRIVSNPAGDRMGEDPWVDAAGDCIIGHIAPRIGPLKEAENEGFDAVFRNMARHNATLSDNDGGDVDPIEAGIPADTP